MYLVFMEGKQENFMIGVKNSSALQWAPTSNFYGKIVIDSFNQEHILAICKKNESGDAYRDFMQ